eukprot:sb/3467471/
MFESDDSDDEDDTINKNYATERSTELKRILTDESCQFATTACIKLNEAPKLLLNPAPTNSDTAVDPSCIVLASNKDKLAEIEKREDEEKFTQIEPSSSAGLNSTVLQKSLNPSERESSLAAKFVELCHDAAFLPGYLLDPVSFGFPCHHLYTNEEIFANSTALDPLDWAQAAQLKGQDAVLVKAVLDAGSCRKTNGSVEVYLQPILECHYIPVGGHSNDTVREISADDKDKYRADKFPDRCTRAKMDDDCTEIWDEFGVEDFDENDHNKIIWVFDQKLGHEPSSLGETEMECSDV